MRLLKEKNALKQVYQEFGDGIPSTFLTKI